MQPHLQVTKKQIAPLVLMPGDPARVDRIGQLLQKFKIIASNREFRIGVGFYKNKKITICSSGIGCPSTAIATEELINLGAKVIIRVGTCGGSWRKDIKIGSLIIPTACIRDEGTTKEYIAQNFPAAANFEVVSALQNSAISNKQKYHIGINRTHDSFYGSLDSIKKWGKYLMENKWKNLDTPIFSSEMESSALFIISSLKGIKAGSILAVNANPEPLKDRLLNKKQKVITETDPKESQRIITNMIRVALDALIEF